jgi:hypothetical protein
MDSIANLSSYFTTNWSRCRGTWHKQALAKVFPNILEDAL